ncbi:sulfatase-like hydrolase/transferase [uncultured Draconibacterium sp.]|uniref:sulfatase family protein n=1 Tax=uncultured Draconibacterium sp. TaxID=1573823 RepID=UPI0025CE3480|nr:sulfatase-like hydrolase/transferase [uncultured Draconibacterium sp.]
MKSKTLTLILALCCAISVFAKERPNVLIIISDDQGWGDVGFNGCTDIPTPNLDKLAEEGVSFQAGYASHPYCSPSRAGLLSGRYQQRFGHENNTPYDHGDPEAGLPVDELMISELLHENGYQTCAIGKWHLGDYEKFWPNERGFDDWFGFFGGGYNYWGNPDKDPNHKIMRNGQAVKPEEITYLTDDFTREAVNYIDSYAKNDKPFFMYLAYNAPHAPIQATREYLDMMEHAEFGDRAAYGAMVAGMDVGIGKVIEKLKETGEYENTLIFFYSDNGGHGMGSRSLPFRGNKGKLFEGGIRVPFLACWPKGINGGNRYLNSISALDIYPTILAATGIEYPEKKLDGVNLLPFVNGENKGKPHDVIFWRYSDGAGYAVQKGDYKIVNSAFKKNRIYLFNLKEDPYEMNDLAEQMPEKLAELQADYEQWTKGTVPAKWHDPHIDNVENDVEKREKYIRAACAGEKKK